MYSEKLESLIAAALADGQVTPQERNVLLRKAQEEGIDTDEFTMVLDARIVEYQKKNAPAVPPTPAAAPRQASGKQGGVIKCPSCGSPVPSMSTVCPECGHEFRNVEAVQSAQRLFESLQAVELRKAEMLKSGNVKPQQIDAQCHNEKLTIIRTFPVPNAKEDLMEMLAMTTSNAYDNDGVVGPDEEAWLQKSDQVYQKIVMVCPEGDATLKRATTLITSLMRRLPKNYKEFTHIPACMIEHAQDEMKQEKEKTAQYRKEKMMEALKSPTGIFGPGVVSLGILFFIIGGIAGSDDVACIAFIMIIVGGIFTKKFSKKIKEIKTSNGIFS